VNGMAKKLSPAVFVLILICFILPFVAFSCGGQKVLSLSGVQLATGASIQQPQAFGPPITRKIDPEPLAVLALLAVVVGLAFSFVRGKKGSIGASVAGGLGVLFLAALKSKLDGDTLQQGGGMVQVRYGTGFSLALILLLAAIGVNVDSLAGGRGIRLPALLDAGGDKFCTQCGARNAAGDLFCKECGAKFG
jgi:hypothetical protein